MSLGNIISLMDDFPLEWEFHPRDDYRTQIVEHKKAKLRVQLKFRYYDDKDPAWVSLAHRSPPDLTFWEHWKLLRAVKRLQRSLYDTIATEYLEKHKPKCPSCKTKLECPKCDKVDNECISN